MNANSQLWQQFFNGKKLEIRDELINNYAPLIKYCAQRIAQGLPNNIEFDDLLSYGALGLIDAINRYNPKLNNNFEAYATLRIRGAIIDGLRKMDWASQSMRRKAKELEKAYTFLQQSLGRNPEVAEVAEYLGISKSEFEKQLSEFGHFSIISLEQPIDSEENSVITLSDKLADERNPSPSKNIEENEEKLALTKAINDLNENERLVITLYYYEELTVKEISNILELSEGRISQIHKKALSKLKGKLAD